MKTLLVVAVLVLAGCQQDLRIPKPIYWHEMTDEDYRQVDRDYLARIYDLCRNHGMCISGDGPCGGGMLSMNDNGDSERSDDCYWMSDQNPPRFAPRYRVTRNGVERDVTRDEFYEAFFGKQDQRE